MLFLCHQEYRLAFDAATPVLAIELARTFQSVCRFVMKVEVRMAEPTTTAESSNRHGIIDEVRERAAAQLSSQKDRATDSLGSVIHAVRQTTGQLRSDKHDTIAGYIDQAADQIDRWSQRLREKDVNDIVRDVQQLARRQPAAFIGSAFALGLVGARFIKSSAERRERSGAYGEDWRRETAESYRRPISEPPLAQGMDVDPLAGTSDTTSAAGSTNRTRGRGAQEGRAAANPSTRTGRGSRTERE